mgnify:CR=1 FL=1
MSKIAFVFPGQGAQYVGMGKDFYEAYPSFRERMSQASSRLGFSMEALCFEDPFLLYECLLWPSGIRIFLVNLDLFYLPEMCI